MYVQEHAILGTLSEVPLYLTNKLVARAIQPDPKGQSEVPQVLPEGWREHWRHLSGRGFIAAVYEIECPHCGPISYLQRVLYPAIDRLFTSMQDYLIADLN